jgi:diguanylate cyclase (GGDEF)-like protein
VKRLLIAIICLSVAATAYMAYVITQRQAALHEVSRDLDSWSVSQTLSEYMRLEHELAEYQLGMPGVSADQLRLRVDIMLGRVDQFKEGSLGRFVQEKPARAELLASLHDVLWAVDGQLDAPPPVDFHDELEKMEALDAPMTTLAASVIAARTTQIDAQEKDLQKLHLLYTALAGSLILCGIALILMLLRQNGLLKGTQSDMNQLVDELRVASTEMLEQSNQMAHLANHDYLTGLANRMFFRKELDERLRAAANGGASVAVFFLDLDGFKDVNDTLGHDVGDDLLEEVGARLQYSTTETDLVCRLGGDEFSVLSTAGTQEEAVEQAQNLIAEMSDPYIINGRAINVGVSVGICLTHGELESDTVLKQADLALYEAKRLGRGRAYVFRQELQTRFLGRKSLEADLRRALIKGEFEVHYQPQADARTGLICGYEALLRWNHPTRGRVLPSDFIPVAEETGLIHAIGDWVLRTACREAAKWKRPLSIAVNLSPVQLRNRTLPLSVRQALDESGLDPHRLELEITESTLLEHSELTQEALSSFKKSGVQIAMDDFGTGYSSLGALRRFQFNRIKIDQSFTRDVPNGRDAMAIITLVIGVARSLGMETTAEGVETEEQLVHLKQLGCDTLQGYFIGKPGPVSTLAPDLY